MATDIIIAPLEADEDPIAELSVTMNLKIQNAHGECVAGEDCIHEQTIDPSEIVESNFTQNCPGVLAYGHIELNNGSIVAMTRDYGSSSGVYNQGERCYPNQVSMGWYYNGRRKVVCAPTKTCSQRGRRC